MAVSDCYKITYQSKTVANKDLHRIWRQGHYGTKLPLRSYKCPNCKRWHLTSKPKG